MAVLFEHPIRWLNHNAGFGQVTLAVVIALITAYYAWVTKRLAATADYQWKAAAMPVLAFEIVPRPPFPDCQFRIAVRNVGIGPALRLAIEYRLTEVGEASRIIDRPRDGIARPPGDRAEVVFCPDVVELALVAAGASYPLAFAELAVSCVDVYERRTSAIATVAWLRPPNGATYTSDLDLTYTHSEPAR